MARARNLKPSFFKDARVVSCSYEARLLFQGLWCLADYMGRLKYNPLEVKMEIFPADPVDVESCVKELADKKLIEIYRDHSGATLVQVSNFTKHQNPHVNERMDKNKNPLPCLPGPDACRVTGGAEKQPLEQRVMDALVVLREYSESDPADSLNLIPPSLFPIASCGDKPADGADAPRTKSKRAHQLPDDFEPTEKHRALAGELGVILIDEFAKFRDYHRAKGSTMKDWNAALNNWLRNAKDFQRGKTSGPPGGSNAERHSGFSEREYTEHTPDWAQET